MACRSAASTGSVYAHSSAWRYWPESLTPKFSLRRWDERNEPVSTLCVPPASEMLVPCASSGDLVMMCSTPSAVFGPYSAAPGPSTTSMRSMSSFVEGMKWSRLTRSEGTPAMRLSVSACSEPEKMLLKPRRTTFVDWTPCVKIETPGEESTWTTGLTASHYATARETTTDTDAGASSAFYCRMEAEITTGLSWNAAATSLAPTSVVCPATTRMPSMS